jgi:hypothetical protein
LWWFVSDWLYSAKERDKWQVFVNTLMGLRISQQAENCSTGLGTMKFFKKEASVEPVMYTASIHPHSLFSVFKLDL